ncbi:protein TolR [Zooshikella marina]|uniref:Tol-Pal system protein TolR n=1 Tax=Zooshikella ganghwensis TaxID=202772 RepID=A0A4P9VMF9_9GAMM|nr:protein TolR [Zooshikella ganghwensis]MBU2704681.1 protein TolR [Zooshikella ganghwensis]RDH43102.1 protein TolR [Zooshikella ganghwensis]
MARRAPRKQMSDINVVPYIDVMLVLLIVFMVTAPMLTQGVNVDLPKTDAKPLDVKEDEEAIIVSVKEDGTYYINIGKQQDQPVPLETITEQVGKILRVKPNRMVLIKGDEKVDYGIVVTAMAALQQAGVPNVGLITDPQDLTQ